MILDDDEIEELCVKLEAAGAKNPKNYLVKTLFAKSMINDDKKLEKISQDVKTLRIQMFFALIGILCIFMVVVELYKN